MGYSYGYDGISGRVLLACDSCGNAGGVRKRTCTHKVSHLNETTGTTHNLPWCQPPALCSPCFKTHGGGKAIHADCAEGAAAAQTRENEKTARMRRGDAIVASAFGSWHESVPEGSTGVIFRGCGGVEVCKLVPADEYDSAQKLFLSCYPDAAPWDGPDRVSKEVVA